MASAARLLTQITTIRSLVPVFLCPILARGSATLPLSSVRRRRGLNNWTCKRHLQSETLPTSTQAIPAYSQLLDLPRSCPGCGAYTQAMSPDQPGFYSSNRKSVKAFVARHGSKADGYGEAGMFNGVASTADGPLLKELGLKDRSKFANSPMRSDDVPTPVCNRCHQLLHHHSGVSVVHPSIKSIQNIIAESPHKYNHVYHVLDAADFPLSLVPSLQRQLSLSPQRSTNRRAKTNVFRHGKKAEMSFIITRCDLLAPKKEQVDRLMPYIIQILRDALAGSAENVRLGNVRCVSSKRGWWTKQVKQDIWDRGGGGWMVGKVNVGKSNLFENIFPKGRTEDVSFDSSRLEARQGSQGTMAHEHSSITSDAGAHYSSREEAEELLLASLLPPAPIEKRYPTLPLVSSLPGTTASPIRLPFGNGKGELIDLPGLARNDLEKFVVEDHKVDLLMRHRIKPEQLTIKPGQSLIIGGLVRITPSIPNVTVLAYPFVPLKCHVTSTEKAIALHSQEAQSGMPTIAKPGIGQHLLPAGTFPLKWDVTKQRAGPLTNKAAAGLSTRVLPFIVLSIDVLIEGCGWVELVAQVRKKDFESTRDSSDFFDTKPYPMVEVVSPDGRHVGVRQPMGAWLLGGKKPGLAGRSVRQRRSMKGVKKQLKKASLAAQH